MDDKQASRYLKKTEQVHIKYKKMIKNLTKQFIKIYPKNK